MKQNITVMSLLFLLLLLLVIVLIATTAQASFGKKSEMGSSSGSVRYRDGTLRSARSRKLMGDTNMELKIERSTERELGTTRAYLRTRLEANSDRAIIEHKKMPPDAYPDLLDIAEMDYSPAKRKPPIHN